MSRPPSNEQDLLERARLHDETAFARLVELYTPVVFRIVRRMVQDTMEAESIVQETFWRFWRVLPRYSSSRPLLPYLATIASNLARDRFRREHLLEDIPAEQVLENYIIEEDEPDLEDRLGEDETLQRLAEEVQALPFAYRSVISLRYEAGMSYDEIAGVLSLPVNTVRTHLRRAKQILRRRMEESNDG